MNQPPSDQLARILQRQQHLEAELQALGMELRALARAVPAEQLAGLPGSVAGDAPLWGSPAAGHHLPAGQPAAPGQQPAPGQLPAPEGLLAPGHPFVPGQQPMPGQPFVPGQEPIPGQPFVPGQQAAPGQLRAPGHQAIAGHHFAPGQPALPGQQPVPGQSAVPGHQPVPGQSAVPGHQPVPGQPTVPGQQPSPGQSAVPGQQPVPGQPTVPGQPFVPGQPVPGHQFLPGQPAPGRPFVPGQQPLPGQPTVPGHYSPGRQPAPGHQFVPRQQQAPGQPAGPAPTPLWQGPGFVAKALAAAGVAVTLLGVAFILVLAAQAGLYGPAPRTLTAAAVAAGLIAGAFWLRRRDPANIGGPALFAAGTASAFLFVVAVSAFYGWVPPVAGLALLWLVGHAATYVARLWQSQFLAVAAVLASLLLTPYVSGTGSEIVAAASMLGLTVVSGILAFGLRWPVLTVARFLPTGAYLIWAVFAPGSGQGPWLPLVLTALFAGLGVATAILDDDTPGRSTVPVLLITGSVLPLLAACDRLPTLAGQVCLGTATIGYLAGGLLAPRVPRACAATLVSAGTLLLTATLRSLLGWEAASLYLGGLAALYLVVATRTADRVVGWLGLTLGALAVGWSLELWAAAASARAAGRTDTLDVLALLALVVVFGALPAAAALLAPRTRLPALVIGWGGGAISACSALVLLGTQVGGVGGFQAAQVAVSVAVMALAGCFLLLGLRAGRNARAYVGLAVAAAVVGVAKLFLWDLSTLPALARGVVFLLVGLLLLGVGTLYAKAYERAQASGGEERPPAPPGP